MAAAVVYDGAGSGGNLFQGKKFWVAQRVPSRSRWLMLLEKNGGQVVQLEKLADILIADHLRKEAAPGSYSWRWIEESVKRGVLEDLEAYRAGPPVGVSRPVGSAHPSKATRTPFTPADDRALALWVTNAERQGLSTKGNDIYQQLEQINPRHPYQSWRDRWVKYGQFQPRPDATSSPTAPGPIPQRSSTTHNKALSNGSTPRPRILTTSSRPSKSKILSKSVIPTTKPMQGNPFTEADGERLLEIYDDIINIDEARLFEAWEKFAEECPQHTAEEWYKFWIVDIKPLRPSARHGMIGKKSQAQVQSTETETGRNSQALDASAKALNVSPEPGSDLRRHHETLRQPPTGKERFEHLVTEFADDHHLESDLQPTISGRTIQLFDLWTIIMKPSFNSSDEEATDKWDQVAEELGFDNSLNPDAAEELKDMYDWILADFAEVRSRALTFLKDLLENGEILTEEQALDLEYLTLIGYEEEDRKVRKQVQKENDAGREAPEIPSSPPQRMLPAIKRDHPGTADLPTERMSSRKYESTPHKRQRVEKGKEKVFEIPSTPEGLLTVAGEVRQSIPVRGQNLILEQDVNNGMSEEEDERNMFVRPVQRKIFPRMNVEPSKTVQFEPETQDFHFSKVAEEGSGTGPSQMAQEEPIAAGESVAAVAGSQFEESSTQSQTDSQREVAEIQELIHRYISLGYPEEVVQEAMLATTLETGDVATVMEAIMQGHGIPDNIEGVWTTEDDRAVRLNDDDEEYARVVLKHTEARCVKRRQLLIQKVILN